jgi:hypothetical protein
MTAPAPTQTTSTDDAVALWRLQSRYADVVTRRAWGELRDLFLPDAAVHIDMVTQAPMSFSGPDSLGTFIGDAIARFDHFAFVILNAVFEVDQDDPESAHGRIFMCEVRHDTATDTWPIAYGMYQDRYLRRDGRWWFAERHYRSMARMGPEGAVLGIPPGTGPLGGR